MGDSLHRSNDGDDGHDFIRISTENSHESYSVNNFSDNDELVMMAGDDGRNCIGVSTKNSHESDSSVQNVSGNNLFVMVSDDGLNDYIFIVIESFEFVPYPSFESSTLLQEVAPSLSECSSGFGSHNMVSAPVEVQVR